MNGNGSVLIVDDSPSGVALVSYYLTAEGYEVQSAGSGESGLLAVSAQPPDLILLDIIMTGMNGFEVCQRLKADEVTRSIPVILLSAIEEEEVRMKGFQLGAVDYISKPIHKEELLARVKVHLDLGRLRKKLEGNIVDLRLAHGYLQRKLAEKDLVEKELLRDEARQRALLGLNQKSELSISEIVNYALEEGIELTWSTIGYIAFVNDDELTFAMQFWSKKIMEQGVIIDKPIDDVVMDMWLWGEVVQRRQAFINNGYAAPYSVKRGGALEGRMELKRHMTIPVFDGKKIVAVAGVGNKETDYTQADVTQLTLMMEGMWRIVSRRRADEEILNISKFPLENPAPVLRIAKDGTVLYSNKKGSDLLAKWHAEIGKKAPERWCRAVKEIFESGKVEKAEEEEEEAGEALYSFTITLVKEGGYVNLYGRDITERKRMEEALHKTETQLTEAIQIAQLGAWEYDVSLNQFIFNDQFYSLFRTTAEREGGYYMSPENYAQKFVHPDDMAVVGAEVRKGLETAAPDYFSQLDHRIIRTDGSIGYISVHIRIKKDAHGRTTNMYGVNQDITARKLAEEELTLHKEHLEDLVQKRTKLLQESEERNLQLLNSTTDYIYIVQIEDGREISTAHGPGCLAVTGHTSEAFKTDPNLWYQMVYMDDRAKVIENAQQLLKGVPVEPYECRIYHRDGTIRWTHNTIVIKKDNSGKVISYDGLVSDITVRKRAEESLIEAKEIAERALAVKDEFTSTVSHELRTPLAAIKSSIDILDTEVPGELTPDQKIFIKRVKSNIDRLARLINDVLDLSKLEAGKMVMNLLPLRVESIIKEVVETQESLVKAKGLTIAAEFGENLPTLVVDKDRLIQVLNNLISNALKFTKEGGVVIAVHCEDKQSVTFSVRDTGIGIKKEDLSKLFQKFQQVGSASQQVSGTGLGLAICKLIIDKHHGRVWIESEFGKGSTFYFNIPIRKEKRILIVDDDEGTLELLKNILETENIYEIETVSDGFMAGQKYYELSPQLIILDINIPKINGLELCAKIKRDPKTKNTRIIIMTTFDEQKKKEAWDAGADEIINKPINSEELIVKIRKII